MKMNFTRCLIPIFAILLVFTSCQKEVDFQDDIQLPPVPPNGGTAEIKGDWKFIGESAKTKTSVTVNEAGQSIQAVTESAYTTENNGGTLKITDNQFLFKGITNSVNSIAHTKTYLNGTLFNESDLPFTGTTPATDYTYDYTRNNTDSITFANAGLMLPSTPGGTPPSSAGPLGARLNITGDVLSIKVVTKINQTITQGGTPALMVAELEGVMQFKRQ